MTKKSGEKNFDVWETRKDDAKKTISFALMKKFPVCFWETYMIFTGVRNIWWRNETNEFPSTNIEEGTHPLFVLGKNSNLSLKKFPCLSYKQITRYVKKGCHLEHTGHITDKNSYIIERFSFSLPVSATFSVQPRFLALSRNNVLSEAVHE